MSQPVLFHGSEAIRTLCEQVNVLEAGISSHWVDMHKEFSVNQGTLTGIKGFGENQPLRAGIKSQIQRVTHQLFQNRFRVMGNGFSRFPEIDRAGREIANRQNRQYGLDRLRQTLTLSLLLEHIPHAFANNEEAALVIGDGFGVFSTLLLFTNSVKKVIVVNIIRTLIVDLSFIQTALPDIGIALATDKTGFDHAMNDDRIAVIALKADDYQLFQGARVNLAVNIASMQEMNPPTIANYFSALRQVSGEPIYFYCCNREDKYLPDGTLVRFNDYPWHTKDH
ncbi:MAG: putative sugar O-methyltransferase, partial [Magnetococcales bacterium]|nr:putative sugar O-methyltransferase [Magnetococcales bacterium]